MKDLLPSVVLDRIRDRYLAGVADAEAKFRFSEGDEDALTGALGQAISDARPTSIVVDDKIYSWHITYRKLRGRGKGAPEKMLGADGIFQIDVSGPVGPPIHTKGLPFQAKKRWSKADGKLVDQCHDIIRELGQGIVIDYSPTGYTSCAAADVVSFGGKKRELKSTGKLRPLGQVLGNDFLNCTIGVKGLFYDVESERFLQAIDASGFFEHSITTRIVRRGLG